MTPNEITAESKTSKTARLEIPSTLSLEIKYEDKGVWKQNTQCLEVAFVLDYHRVC